MSREPRPESTESDERAESGLPTDRGAREALVEQLAEAMRKDWNEIAEAVLSPVGDDEAISALRLRCPNTLAVVADQVEAAVSVVRAEMALEVAQRYCDNDVANRWHFELGEGRSEITRLRERLMRMTCVARDRGDEVDFADAHLPRWEAIRDERDALREKVARVEAAFHEARTQCVALRERVAHLTGERGVSFDMASVGDERDVLSSVSDAEFEEQRRVAADDAGLVRVDTTEDGRAVYAAALSDPTTPDQEGGQS